MSVTITLTTPDGSPLTKQDVPAKGTLLVLKVDTMGEDWPPDGTAQVLGWVPPAKAAGLAPELLKNACRALNEG